MREDPRYRFLTGSVHWFRLYVRRRTCRHTEIFSKTLLLSSDMRSEGSIAIVKKFDFDFFFYEFRFYRVIQIIHSATVGCRSRPWLAGQPPDATSHCRYSQTLALFFSSLSEQLVTRIDVHLYSGDVSVY